MTDIKNSGVVKPAGKVVFDSIGAHHQVLYVESGTTMYPGGLVIQGTDDKDISTCGAGGEGFGWLGYEDTLKKYRPATIDTLYVTGDWADVVNGPGIVVRARIANGQNIPKGTRLVATAAGELIAASTAAPPSGTVAVVSTGAQPVAAGPLSTQGIVVAIAYESIDASGGATAGLVTSLI
jgi:hypothetical protein